MFEIKLNEQKLNMVLQALQELPYRVSREVIEDIMRQAQSQVQQLAPDLPEVDED